MCYNGLALSGRTGSGSYEPHTSGGIGISPRSPVVKDGGEGCYPFSRLRSQLPERCPVSLGSSLLLKHGLPADPLLYFLQTWRLFFFSFPPNCSKCFLPKRHLGFVSRIKSFQDWNSFCLNASFNIQHDQLI